MKDGLSVSLIEVPGVFSQGETLEELKENINEAYQLMLEADPSEFLPRETESNLQWS